jgi:hypothetical protein
MMRLLIAGAIVYVAYRLAKKVIEEVPDDFDPVLLPSGQDDREGLRRQSAAMGIYPTR